MKAIYLNNDGSIRIEEPRMQKYDLPMPFVKAYKMKPLRPSPFDPPSEAELSEPIIDEIEYLHIATTNAFFVYKELP